MSGHAVVVLAAGVIYPHPESAFIVAEDGSLTVWREDRTEVAVYPAGHWQRVSATGTGLGPYDDE